MMPRKGYLVLSLAIVIVMIGPCFYCGAALAIETERTEVVYNLYFGDLHSHTSYSDGTGLHDDAYEMAKTSGASFLAITDHYFPLTEVEWQAMRESADRNTIDGEFIGMAAYEYYLPGINELNVYGSENLAPRSGLAPEAYYQGDRMTDYSYMPWMYDWITQEQGAIGQWNHPSSYGCPLIWDFFQYDYYTETRDAGMSMIECYNWGYRDPSYVKALDAGWHVMPTATEDDHYGDWISPLGIRTVLLAESLTRENLYDAMREGRGYATLDDNLNIRFTLNGEVMGSNLSRPGDAEYVASIEIDDPDGKGDEITMVEIVSDGNETVRCFYPNSDEFTNLDIRLSGDDAPRYFFVRVTTASPLNGDIEGVTAWTAPVWTGN
ncbi:MAG: CehA/McbA family metallohydrolase [Methanobacteriota archaeon]|nr:MAG: CehA/McbA family metallohydrolase [Euryarchaeota archaeon]